LRNRFCRNFSVHLRRNLVADGFTTC
jgi:hypothetical protein